MNSPHSPPTRPESGAPAPHGHLIDTQAGAVSRRERSDKNRTPHTQQQEISSATQVCIQHRGAEPERPYLAPLGTPTPGQHHYPERASKPPNPPVGTWTHQFLVVVRPALASYRHRQGVFRKQNPLGETFPAPPRLAHSTKEQSQQGHTSRRSAPLLQNRIGVQSVHASQCQSTPSGYFSIP